MVWYELEYILKKKAMVITNTFTIIKCILYCGAGEGYINIGVALEKYLFIVLFTFLHIHIIGYRILKLLISASLKKKHKAKQN